jgi:ACS family hexuronate transporter-like MFS transporter
MLASSSKPKEDYSSEIVNIDTFFIFRYPSISMKKAIPGLRWWIGGLLLASTIINYIDRQTLAVLAPRLKLDFHWNNQSFAVVIIGFRIAYAIGQAGAGRFLDKVGTRKGLSLSVSWYSLAAMATSLATGLWSLFALRFCLGLGEAANWPGATKAVSEWFPRRERAWAVALFDSGSSIGAAVAPMIVLALQSHFGSWRAAFVITGGLSLTWVIAWRAFYQSPEEHARISAEERSLILADRDRERLPMAGGRWLDLLKMRQTWGLIVGRLLTDPVWYFITDWFAIFLVARGYRLEQSLLVFWIPFVAADAGNFLGGGISSWLVKRGWAVMRARKAVIAVCGLGMASLAFSAISTSLPALAALFSISTCCYAAWSTMALTLPSDLYPQEHVASVSGLTGAGSGIGTILSTYLIGLVSDHISFTPVLLAGSAVPLAATAAVFLLVRRDQAG